jgi:SWI/SNF-related matrix-associated actin-dependent regulator of chromatin subfamily A-like protein 1
MPKLYPYQEEGVKWLSQRKASALCDQQGLGKTIQIISVVNLWMEKRDTLSILIVCPASLKTNWLHEWGQWTTTKLSVGIAESKHFPNTDVIIVNYDVLNKPEVYKRTHAKEFDVLVMDEVQYIRNKKAQRTRAVVGGRGAPPILAKVKIALTGTIMVNRPIDSWVILNYLQPGQWFSRHIFACRYCNAFQSHFGWDYSGHSRLPELNDKLKGIMLRRRKDDVLKDLPRKNRQIIEVDVDRKLLPDSVSLASDDQFKNAVAQLKGGGSVDFDMISKIRKELAIAKIPVVIEHLEAAIESSGKAVCFCHHTDLVNAISDHFHDRSVKLVGGTSLKQRDYNIHVFQNTDMPLFIGNIQAAGVGITLTAASHIVFAELSWIPGDILQAEDRCHRIGATAESLLIQYLVVADSLEVHMARVMVEKMKVIEQAIPDEVSTLERMLS